VDILMLVPLRVVSGAAGCVGASSSVDMEYT
jgi:hypothetical protein